MKHIHILGICGTFMGGLAIIARQSGLRVTGSDENVYPPMSTQLDEIGIELFSGYDPELIKQLNPDCVIIGNVLSRGNAVIEYLLSNNIAYTSGPQWLAENILQHRWVVAVAGTHGKTTTASMVAWILEYAKMEPGFLIGGIPKNFGVSAKMGNSSFFVIEADEYDTAFFDKRSKFVHYKPRTLVLNNLEFDHADIFADLDAIKTQFHHLIRIIPGNGLIISNQADDNLNSVLQQGSWTDIEYQNSNFSNSDIWSYKLMAADGSRFEIYFKGIKYGELNWTLQGEHNIVNALSAIAAARHVGIVPEHAIDALQQFENVKRRMELRGIVNTISVYDDFAHHPTAINTTLNGLRNHVLENKITVILEARSNTMKSGIFNTKLPTALSAADQVILYQDNNNLDDVVAKINNDNGKAFIFDTVNKIIEFCCTNVVEHEHILIMSNGGFEDIHTRLLTALSGANVTRQN